MVAFDNLDLRLFPGMTAYISIPVAEAKNVTKIPNGALRFKPDLTDSERTDLYAKYGIKDTSRATTAGRIAAASADGSAPAGGSGSASAAAASSGSDNGAARSSQGGGGGGSGRDGKAGAAARDNGGGDQSGASSAGGGGGRGQTSAIIWKLLADKTLEPVQVTLGVTDFTFTELVSGSVSPGDDLVIGQSANKSSSSAQVRNPVSGAGAPQGVPRRF
jgi:hypothetical protein